MANSQCTFVGLSLFIHGADISPVFTPQVEFGGRGDFRRVELHARIPSPAADAHTRGSLAAPWGRPAGSAPLPNRVCQRPCTPYSHGCCPGRPSCLLVGGCHRPQTYNTNCIFVKNTFVVLTGMTTSISLPFFMSPIKRLHEVQVPKGHICGPYCIFLPVSLDWG